MAIVEAISIPIGVTGQDTVDKAANSYEDLGDAVAKTQLEAEKLANTFGINDKRTQDAIKVAGKYKQEMEQLDSAIDGARGGVATLTRATQGVVAGFEVAAGAAGLFGGESEELQKMLLKVQSAMALSQGISDLKEYGSSIGGLGSMIKGSVVKAFGSLRAAIISTGIGAAVVAVGLLVANWDSLVSKFSLSFPTLDGIGAKLKNVVQGITDYIGVTSEAGRTNDQVNASIQKNINDLDKQSKLARARGDEEKALALEGNKLAAESVLANRKLRAEDNDANKKAVEDARLALELNQIAKDKLAKDASTKTKEQNKKAADEEFEAFIAQEVSNEEYREKKRQEQKRLEDEEFEMEMAQIVENDRRQQELADEEFNNFYAQEVANEERRTQLKEKAAEDDKKRAEDAIKLQEDVFKAAQELLQLSNSFIENSNAKLTEQHNTRIEELKAQGFNEQQIADMRDDELIRIDERAKQNFEIAKRIRYAETLLSTIQGTQQAFTTANASPLTAVFPAYPFIQAATAAAFGIAQLQQISQSKYESKNKPSASGGGGAPTIPQFNAPTTRLQAQGDEFTQVRRIYVTERDITNVQDKVRVTEGLSQF